MGGAVRDEMLGLEVAERDWVIWLAPFGRAGKRSSTALRLLERTSHSLRGVPCGQPLPNSLNMSISSLMGTRAGIGLGPVTNCNPELMYKYAILFQQFS